MGGWARGRANGVRIPELVEAISWPIRVWKWHPGAPPLAAVKSNAAKPGPNGASVSIAVLPFTNMSGDPEQEYFSDGISEDIFRKIFLRAFISGKTSVRSDCEQIPRSGIDHALFG